MESRTLVDLKTFNATLRALTAKVANADLDYKVRAEAEKELAHFIFDFHFAHENQAYAMPKLAERIQKDFVYPIL